MQKSAIIPVTAPIEEGDDAPVKRFWWTKRVAIVLMLFVAFVIGSWFWLRVRAERELVAELGEWRKEGLPIHPWDFEGQAVVPDGENAALALNAAVRAIADVSGWEKAYMGNAFDRYPWSAATLATVDEATRINHQSLEMLRAARGLTRVRWKSAPLRDLTNDKHDPRQIDLSGMRALANLVRTAGMAAHQRGDEAGFLNFIHDLQFMAETIAADSTTVSHAVATDMDAMAAGMVDEAAGELQLNTVELRAEAVARQAEWSIPNRLPPKWRALAREGQYVMEFRADVGHAAETQMAHGGVRQFLQGAIFRVVGPRQFAQALRYIRGEVHATQQPNWPAMSAALDRVQFPPAPFLDVEPLDSLTTDIRSMLSGSRPLLKTYCGREMRVNIAVVHLACRMYAIDHDGKDPAVLAELVPRYLPALPVDPFDPNGGPLRMARKGGQPFVYSIEGGVDLVKTGAWSPSMQTHEIELDGMFVSFLHPHAKMVGTRPAFNPGAPR